MTMDRKLLKAIAYYKRKIDRLKAEVAAKDKEIADLKESLTWALDAAERTE